MLRAARLCCLPANELMLKLIRRYGKAFACPSPFRARRLTSLNSTFLKCLRALRLWRKQAAWNLWPKPRRIHWPFSIPCQSSTARYRHRRPASKLFGVKPVTFKHTECVYNNDLAVAVAELGFKGRARKERIRRWAGAAPTTCTGPSAPPELGLLLRNTSLSNDIGLRFSDAAWPAWPLTADAFASWCHGLADSADVINIINDYHVFGLRHSKDSGIFDFMEALPEALLARKGLHFATPAMAVKKFNPVGKMDIPQFISWEDESGDLTAWLGNDMQKDAIHDYALASRVDRSGSPN